MFDHVVDMIKHAMWVFGQDSADGVRAVARAMNLESVIGKLTCPLFVIHGENDRQVPLWTAQKTYDEAVNSSRRDLKIFTLEEGGAEHCQIDNRQLIGDVMSDWAAEIFGTSPAGIH
jgi:fermentation-respiration switch protein FrsA (DUF1100 family)